VNTIAMPSRSAAAITSASFTLPPGWATAVTPRAIAASRPSGNGKNASEASTLPLALSPAFSQAICTLTTRDIWWSEEMYALYGFEPSLLDVPWPSYSPDLAREEMITIVVQVNGKVRDQIQVAESAAAEDVIEAARNAAKARLRSIPPSTTPMVKLCTPRSQKGKLGERRAA